MGLLSKIGWTDHTWNMTWGCSKVPGDPACEHCYAESYAKMRGFDVWGDDKVRRLLSENNWKQPLRWNEKARAARKHAFVFTSSMADVYEERPEYYGLRRRHYELMCATPWLIWLVLTKRPQRAKQYWRNLAVPDNMWLGVTAVTQKWADVRLPVAQAVGAPVTFLSAEPLMEPLALKRHLDKGLGWVIVGGESGGRRREMDIAWVRDIADQCKRANVPLYVKQDSAFRPEQQGRIPDDLWALKGRPAP